MSFAADAARQQQWMHPALFSQTSTHSGFGGFATGTSPLISTPSSAGFWSSSTTTGPTSPLTPDGHLSRNQTSQRARGDPKPLDKTLSIPPVLPPVYRLSSWPDFAKDDLTVGGAGHHDGLLAAESDRLGDSLVITTTGLDDDKLDPFPDLEKNGGTPISEDANFFSSPPSEASDESSLNTATPDDADSKTCKAMTTPSYMAVTARPLTAKEYQRYRSQRRGEVPTRPSRSASDHLQRTILDDSRPRSGSEGCFGGLGVASGIVGAETVAMKALGERKAYRKPSSSPVCTTREEFEALPPAIQRKYFSTVERLRLTQPPNVTIDSSQANNDFYDFSSTPLKLRKSRRSLGGLELNPNQPRPRTAHQPRTLSVDSALRSPPSRISQGGRLSPYLKRVAARSKTLSVIVDTADESSSKAETPTRTDTPNDNESGPRDPVPSSPTAANMDASRLDTTGKKRQSMVPDSFFESFRFMEDGDDLDLRLQLDRFNEIPEEPGQTTAKRAKQRHPSFRKNFSISKISLNRSSQVPPTRPETKDRGVTPTSPSPSLSSPISPVNSNHGRRRSRAFSLRGGQPSIAEGMAAPATSSPPIDPEAAHYQDPEARLKLRLYLASPQKFDEAVEFGFPAAELAAPKRKTEPHPLRKQQSCVELSDPEFNTHEGASATADDKSSVYSDDGSVAEPDSPKTPEPLEKPPTRPFRAVSDGTVKPVRQHGYSGSHASSREMTLRMTLTRPDLRAHEEQIYGWQQKDAAQKVQSPGSREEASRSPSVMYVGEGSTKDSIERQFAAMDTWPEPEKGVVKRFWNKVRRG